MRSGPITRLIQYPTPIKDCHDLPSDLQAGWSGVRLVEFKCEVQQRRTGKGWLSMSRHHGCLNFQFQFARCTSTSTEENDTKSIEPYASNSFHHRRVVLHEVGRKWLKASMTDLLVTCIVIHRRVRLLSESEAWKWRPRT